VLGCPTGHAHATAQIELQVGTDIYVGRGTGTGLGGLYYNAFTGTPSAIEEALETAIYGLTLAGHTSQPLFLPYGPSPPNSPLPFSPDGPGAGTRPFGAGGI
jgi:hypothetical protein